jgi:hypothetical protein
MNPYYLARVIVVGASSALAGVKIAKTVQAGRAAREEILENHYRELAAIKLAGRRVNDKLDIHGLKYAPDAETLMSEFKWEIIIANEELK